MCVCVRACVQRLQKPVVAIETSRENYEWKRHKGRHHQCLCGYCFNIFPAIFCRLPATAQLESGVWCLCNTFQINFTDLLFYSFTHSLVFGWHATPPCAPGCVPINLIYWCNSSLVRQEVQYCVPQCHLLSFHYCLLVLLHCSSSKKTLNPLCDLPRLHNPTLFLSNFKVLRKA